MGLVKVRTVNLIDTHWQNNDAPIKFAALKQIIKREILRVLLSVEEEVKVPKSLRKSRKQSHMAPGRDINYVYDRPHKRLKPH